LGLQTTHIHKNIIEYEEKYMQTAAPFFLSNISSHNLAYFFFLSRSFLNHLSLHTQFRNDVGDVKNLVHAGERVLSVIIVASAYLGVEEIFSLIEEE